MSKQLIKQPNMIIFWLVLASGLAVVLIDQSNAGGGGVLPTVARTVFWCSAIAYFSLRIFQYVKQRFLRQVKDGNKTTETEPGPDKDFPDHV